MTIERYIRTTFECSNGITFEPGLEWRTDDDCKAIRAELRGLSRIATLIQGDAIEVAKAFGGLLRERFPGRYYFVEVFGADGEWAQEYQSPNGGRGRNTCSTP